MGRGYSLRSVAGKMGITIFAMVLAALSPFYNPMREYSVKALARVVIKIESDGDEKAVSRCGAKGLMQLMPANIKRFKVEDPFNPLQNVKAGVALLEEELARFKDDKLALAAYNAGSPRVKAAIQAAGSTEWNKVREHLPVETRQYVDRAAALLLGRQVKLCLKHEAILNYLI